MSGGLPEGVAATSPAALLATCGGIGLLRPAPGSWASAAALAPGIALLWLAGPWALLAAAVLLAAVGLAAVSRLLRSFPPGACRDHPAIVIDEAAGQWVALAPALASPPLWVAALLLFRLFDIWKPWPVAMLERRLPGALGVMADDLAAGAMAAACVAGLGLAGLGAGLGDVR